MTRRRVLLTSFLLVGCGVAAAAVGIDASGTTTTPLDWTKPTAIVVLGARVNEDGRASDTLEARVMHGVAVWNISPASPLIISGGVGTFGAAEADVGGALAVDAGVPDSLVLRERSSHSTKENAAFTALMLKEAGFERVVLISDPYHLPRARLEFEKLGFSVQTSPVLEAPRHQRLLTRIYWTLREVAALARAKLIS
ncbi:MAG: YdcF family protein [Archangium sp.]|nr:YdcF family protein [Archangium sp.]